MKKIHHPTNVWGEHWGMSCTCRLKCTNMPCPIHRRQAYVLAVNKKRVSEGRLKYKPYFLEVEEP